MVHSALLETGASAATDLRFALTRMALAQGDSYSSHRRSAQGRDSLRRTPTHNPNGYGGEEGGVWRTKLERSAPNLGARLRLQRSSETRTSTG
eukprot:6916863-Pyramimonas_sp.AAC.1